MFSPDHSFHPFSHYEVGKPQSYRGAHYLRCYLNVLLIIKDAGLPTENTVRKFYSEGYVKEWPATEEEKKFILDSVAQHNLTLAAQEKKLAEVAHPLTGYKTEVDFKREETYAVLQHEFAITTADCTKPVLGTYGAGPCLIVALHDPETKKAILAHIDGLTQIDSLKEMLKLVSPASSVVHLYGGNLASKAMCMEVVELLETHGFRIVNADIVRREGAAASMAIDARTGAIYSPVGPAQLGAASDEERRIAFIALASHPYPIYKIYEGALPPPCSFRALVGTSNAVPLPLPISTA